jgi:hypothetical protein
VQGCKVFYQQVGLDISCHMQPGLVVNSLNAPFTKPFKESCVVRTCLCPFRNLSADFGCLPMVVTIEMTF